MRKIKIVKDLKANGSWIRVGEIYDARILVSRPFEINAPYQIIDGPCSGTIVPRVHCMEVSEEKTYTEKEWNDMENYNMKQLDQVGETQKVKLPQEVYAALERIKLSWSKHLSNDDLYALLLNINVYGTTGDALILKKFAAINPVEYVRALANGYVPENTNITQEVSEMLDKWLSAEYVENEKKDIQLFAEKLTNFYKQKLSKTS